MKHGVTLTAKSECTVLHKTAFTPDTNKKFRDSPKPPSNLTILWKDLQNLLKAIILTGVLRERIQVKNKSKQDA